MAFFLGTSGRDNLVGTNSSDSLFGLEDNDVLDGAGGADFLAGGLGEGVATTMSMAASAAIRSGAKKTMTCCGAASASTF